MSAKMRISPVSWIVSIETGPRAGGVYFPGTCPWSCTRWPRLPLNLCKRPQLKHLTFKTVFLLALGSGKHRSEIHAWLHKNIRHQSDWSKVSLYPSPSFLSKNKLAKEGPDSVAIVVTPAWPPLWISHSWAQVLVSSQSSSVLLRQDLRS